MDKRGRSILFNKMIRTLGGFGNPPLRTSYRLTRRVAPTRFNLHQYAPWSKSAEENSCRSIFGRLWINW
jgi:hypothetical protein